MEDSSTTTAAGVNELAKDKNNTAVKKNEVHSAKTRNQESVGTFLEMLEVQVMVIFVIALDVLGVGIQLYLDTQPSSNTLLIMFLSLLQSFNGFSLIFFILELALTLYAFGPATFFTHIGYVTDVILVTLALYWELQYSSNAVRLLGIFRAWRVARIVNYLLTAEQLEHDATRASLQASLRRESASRVEIELLEKSLDAEKTSREGVETSLRGYKDEVDTLKEALNIAALSVAEASVEEYGYMDEEQLLKFAAKSEEMAQSAMNTAEPEGDALDSFQDTLTS